MAEPRQRRSTIKLFSEDVTFSPGEDVEYFSVSADFDFSKNCGSTRSGAGVFWRAMVAQCWLFDPQHDDQSEQQDREGANWDQSFRHRN